MLLFDELNRTTAAYCHALGLDASAYETPLSADEVEIADYMKRHGMNRQAAESFVALHKMPSASEWFSSQPKKYHAVVEYAANSYQDKRTAEQVAADQVKFAESLGEYYAACRARQTIGPYFVGD